MKNKLLLSIAFISSLLLGSGFVSAQQTDATLSFSPSVTQAVTGEEFEIDIMLNNPSGQNIISVRSWLEFNNDVIEGVSINTDGSPFSLSAPGEDEFSLTDGIVKIGRSNVSGGFSEASTKVATVKFKVKTTFNLNTLIEAHDYQLTELGHTSVNIIDGGFPVNILDSEPVPISILLNPGGIPYGNDDIIVPDNNSNQVNNPVVSFADLERPKNLRVMTGPGYVDLRWDMSDESELAGYNLYYGKTSGRYTRRRSVGKVGSYRLEGLNNGEVYYFAITAYDGLSRESDYSDEVGIIINEPLSSTSPFEQFTADLLANVPVQPQNGPLVGWLSFSALGLGGTLAFRKKQNS